MLLPQHKQTLCFETCHQNRGQKFVNTGALRSCRGGVDIQIWQNFRWFIVFQISIWGGLKLCLGGLSPPKLPRGDGTACHLRPVDYLKFSLRKNESRVIVFQKYEWRHCWDGTTCSAGTIRIKDWQHYKDFSSYWTTSRSSLQVMFMITEPWFKSSAATSFRN